MQSQERGIRNELIIHINVSQLVQRKHIYRQQKTEIYIHIKEKKGKKSKYQLL